MRHSSVKNLIFFFIVVKIIPSAFRKYFLLLKLVEYSFPLSMH